MLPARITAFIQKVQPERKKTFRHLSGRVYLLPQAQSSPHLFSGVHWQLSPQEQSLPQRHSSPH